LIYEIEPIGGVNSVVDALQGIVCLLLVQGGTTDWGQVEAAERAVRAGADSY